MADAASPGFSGLLAVVNPRSMPDPETLERALAGGDSFCGWNKLLDHAERHRVVPLFTHRLHSINWMEGTKFPLEPPLRARLEMAQRSAVFAEMSSLAELQRLSARMAEKGIVPILLKGLALSALCYGELGLRTNRDIDLLIPPEDLERCDRLLSEMGYVRVSPQSSLTEAECAQWRLWHKDWVYLHQSRNTIVEMHYRLFDNAVLSKGLDPGQTVSMDLFGQHAMLSLAGDSLRSYLALHGLLHSWSRLKWLIDYDRLPDTAGCASSAPLAVRVADRLCDTLFAPSDFPRRNRIIGREALLLRASLNAMRGGGTAELEATRFGTTIKNLSHYLISFQPAYWWEELRYDLADTSRDEDAGRPASGSVRRIGRWIGRRLRAGRPRLG